MLGRVYTFERDGETDFLHGLGFVSALAVNAIVAAINDQPGIRFEELTDSDNARPVVVVLFAGLKQQEYFDELIDSALKLSGVKAHIVHNGNLGAGLIDQPAAGLPSDIDLTKLRTLLPTRAA